MSSYTVKPGSSGFSLSISRSTALSSGLSRFPPAVFAAFAPVVPVFGVDKSQNTSWVSLSACPSCQMRWMLSTQRLTLLFGSSGRSGLMMRWSSPSLRPSEVILSILSVPGSTSWACTLAARSDSSCTICFCISVGCATSL